jgi:DnaJ-class molecular chaperone
VLKCFWYIIKTKRIDAMEHCLNCSGSGTIMGMGMLSKDCEACDGDGKIDNLESEIAKIKPIVDRKSSAYRSAIKEIMSVNKNMSKEQAETLFDEAYNHG